MKRILREPLLHFLLLGAMLFAGYHLVSKHTGFEPGKIVVTQGQIEHLALGFTRTWQRPPTVEELNGLIRDYIREEVYCREAVALGLDRDDTVVRRRLQQKLEFVSDDVAALAEPTDADLQSFLQAHPDKFRVEQRFTFSQVYLNPEHRRETLAADAAKLLGELNQVGAQTNLSALGDSFLLENQFDAIPVTEAAKLFGEKFAARLAELTPRQWQGPVESGYGAHLVLVKERTPGRLPALADVRDAVRSEWVNVHRLAANEQFYQGLLKHYTVTIEQPKLKDGEKKLAVAK